MALPDYAKLAQGTAIVLADTTDYVAGANNWNLTRTDQIDLTSLAAGGYRQSAGIDFGTRDPSYAILVSVEFATAPAAGEQIEIYLAPSPDNSNFPANVSGTDSAYTGYSSNADNSIKQCQLIGSMPLTVQATTTVQMGYAGEFSPPTRYGAIVVKNGSAADALHSDAVEMSICLIPIQELVQDAS